MSRFTATQRKAIYAGLTALVPIVVAFGLISGEQAASIVAALGAVFGSILAFNNVSDK